MYGIERMLKKIRQKVHNKARVEASIVEGFLVEEISNITSLFLPELISSSSNRPHRYAQSGLPSNCTLSLFQVRGWKTGRGVSRTLTLQEYKTTIIYIFTNLSERDEYVQKFEQEQWRRPRPPSQKQLDKLKLNGAGSGKPDLLDWYRSLCDRDLTVPSELRLLSRGSSLKVKSFDIYEINEYRFRSEKYEQSRGNLTTNNTGVLAVGFDDCSNKKIEYYGIIKDIIELKFDGDSNFSLVLFDCHWFHPISGVRHLERHWIQDPPLGKGRAPSSVLTCLLKNCHPGLVEFRGKTVVASTWKHYQEVKDNQGKSLVDDVLEHFWQRFRYDPSQESEIREHVGRCCNQLLGSIIYYARIYATLDNFRNVKKRFICDKIAGLFYLAKDEYKEQRPIWCKEECWNVLAEEWSHPDFKKRFERNRANRCSHTFKPHKGGSNSIATICQKLAKERGRQVSEVEAWVYTHRGPNSEEPETLNTEHATACLESYKAKAMELNRPDFDWLHSSVDVKALFECACGRQHGKWALLNGIIDDSEALAEAKSNQASSIAARRRRQEAVERMRKEASDSRAAKEYAQNMLEWGRMVQRYNENIQQFMENVAAHTVMSTTAVPPLPPPPLPLMYGLSTSLNQSRERVCTFGSYVGVETPEETLNRIAHGGFGGRVTVTSGGGGNGSRDPSNGAASGGANYSPLQDDFSMF